MANPKWTEELDEKLYFLAIKYLDELSAHEYFNKSSNTIRNISDEFSVSWASPSSVLYRLAAHKFFKTRKNSCKDGIFYRQSSLPALVRDFKVCPKFNNLDDQLKCEITKKFLKLLPTQRFDVIAVCELVAGQYKSSALKIQKVVYDQELVEIHYPPRKLVVLNEIQNELSLSQGSWKNRIVGKDIKDDINSYRALLGKFYRPTSHSLPAIARSSDGTGFGKSYSVFSAFINSSENEPGISHRCFIFTTPQKAQIDIDEALIHLAKTNGLPILPILAFDDLKNLDFKDWIDGVTNRDRYLDWSKRGVRLCPYMKSSLMKLESLVNQITRMEVLLSDVQSPIERELISKQLSSLKFAVNNTLKTAALAAINRFNEPVELSDLIEQANNSEVNAIRLEIISRVFPMQIALYRPCLFVLTTKKFDKNTLMLRKKRDGLFRDTSCNFDELLGGSRRPKLGLVESKSAIQSGTHEDQIRFLEREYFSEDADNPFVQKNVAFTLVIDEEHESYDELRDGCVVNLITEDSNLPHVLSTIFRVYKSIEGVRGHGSFDTPPLYTELKAFFKDIDDALNKCELSKNQTLVSLLRLFESNIGYVQIARSEADQILNITRNLFNFSPKHFFNEQALKNIKIKALQNNTVCKLFYSTEDSESANLHDIFQLIMAILFASSRVKSSDVQTMFGQVLEWSQNSPLSRFIDIAKENRDSVEYLFERISDINLKIDHFFTYFQPKTVFSLEPKQRSEFQDPSLKNFIYVDFTLALLRELPETMLMRICRRRSNIVYLLSATTGFHQIYNGNFNFEMLSLYGNSKGRNLDFNVNKRKKDELATLQNLRNARGKARTVELHEFDVTTHYITGADTPPTIQQVVKRWERKLDPGISVMYSKYTRREFLRTLHSLIMAAKDAKSSLVLTLSTRFFRVIKDYVQGSQDSCSELYYHSEYGIPVYTFKPFDNGNQVRLVCYDAKLKASVDLKKTTTLSPAGETLVIVAAYQSGGTGLNFFVRYLGTNFKEDFARLVLVNSPYWSEVRRPQKGLNTLDNWLTLLKYYSDSDYQKLLSDFDVNLVNGENYEVLEREHQMSVFKRVIQAIGRVEREDTFLHSEIYLPSDLMEWAMLHFSRLEEDGKSQVVLGSMSFLNTHLKEKCLFLSRKRTFPSTTDRKEFEYKIFKNNRVLNSFFEKVVVSEILDIRSYGAKPVINERLRSIESVYNPRKWLQNLQSIDAIKQNSYLTDVVRSFFIDRLSMKNNVIFCRGNEEGVLLTDLTRGQLLYKPAESILPPMLASSVEKNGTFWKRYSELSSLRETAFTDMVPHPAIIPLLKGNVGEYLLDAALEHIGVETLSGEAYIKKMPSDIYEYFDRFVELNNKLFCIDAKNWSSMFDQHERALETWEDAKSKAEMIRKLLSKYYQKIIFVYVNTRYDHNPLNFKGEHEGENIFFLNLLKQEHFHNGVDIKTGGMPLSSEVILNPNFINIFS